MKQIDQLIINSPYGEPSRYWSYRRDAREFTLKEGRRPAGYLRASEKSRGFDDPGVFVELPLVNKIRPRVRAWRDAGYPGVSGITKRLLQHWSDKEQRQLRFFFCQLEAIETLIWMLEAAESEKTGIDLPGDGGPFRRLCAKMATGSGKTIVMAQLIAWPILNKVAYPQDKRFVEAHFHSGAGADGEKPVTGAATLRAEQLLPGVSRDSGGTRGRFAARQGAGAQLARAGLGDGSAGGAQTHRG